MEAGSAAPVAPDSPATGESAPAAAPTETVVTESAPPEPQETAPETAAPDTQVDSTEGAEAGTEEAPESPLWNDEQWTAWDGTIDSLDERYHEIFNRLSGTHAEQISSLESRLAESQESVKALLFGDEDPHAGRELSEAKAARDEAVGRAEAAEKALQELQEERSRTDAEREAAEVEKFWADHAWLKEESTSPEVRGAVASLIDREMAPTRAGDVFKGVPPEVAAVMAESILRGDSVETSRELAELKTRKPERPKLPDPKPGEGFVSGTEPASNTSRRKRTQNEVSPKLARQLMAAQMFARR